MLKLTVQGTLSAINSMLVELGLVLVVAATAKHWGTPCPLLFQWGLAIFLGGMGLFIGALILRRANARSVHHESYERLASFLAAPALVTASVCLALSFVP